MHITNSTRLSYHLIDKNDAEFLFQLDQNPEVMLYLNGGKPTTQKDILDNFIPRLYAYRNTEKGWGLWKVTITKTQQDIGWILVRPMDFFTDTPRFNDIELGWRFLQSSWGKGYATEAAQHILQTISSESEYQFFSATALKDNVASIAIMKKIGMEYIKNYRYSDDNFSNVNAVLYQINVAQSN